MIFKYNIEKLGNIVNLFLQEGKMVADKKERKYWLSLNTVTWVIILIVSFFVFFPAFVTLLIIWAVGRIEVKD